MKKLIVVVPIIFASLMFGVALAGAQDGPQSTTKPVPTTVVPGVGVIVNNNPVTPPDKVPKVWGSGPKPADVVPPVNCPADGLQYEAHYNLYPDGSSAEENRLFNCGQAQPGLCWAPPKVTQAGQPVQTGLDYTKSVCSNGLPDPRAPHTSTTLPTGCWAPPAEQLYPGQQVSGYDLTKEICS